MEAVVERSWLMGLLDRLLGVGKAERKEPRITTPAEFRRIEQTQKELDSRLAAVEGRVVRVEKALKLANGDRQHTHAHEEEEKPDGS